MEAKGETCGVRKLPHSLHGDMQWRQTRLGARANLVARVERISNDAPREMIIPDCRQAGTTEFGL